MTIKPCPCGQTPPDFCLEAVGMKYAHASPNCCNDWGFEFRINYEQDTTKIQAMAAETWNAMPRRSPLSQETVDDLKLWLHRAESHQPAEWPWTEMPFLMRRILAEIEGDQR